MAADSRLLGFLALLCYFLLLHSAAAQWNCPISSCRNIGLVEFPIPKPNEDSECDLPISECNNPEVHLRNQTYKIERLFQAGYISTFILEATATISFWEVSMLAYPYRVSRAFFRCADQSNGIADQDGPSTSCPPYNISFGSDNHFPADKINDLFQSQSNPCSVALNLSGQQPDSTHKCTSLKSFLDIEEQLSKICDHCHRSSSDCHRYQLQFYCDDDHDILFSSPAPQTPPANRTEVKGRSKAAIIGLSTGLAAMTTIALCAILLLYKRRHSSLAYQNKTRSIYSNPNSTFPESRNVYFGIPVFSYEELQEATNNFDQAGELGEGGFGTVYYGMLRDGREVAVKRLYERNYRPVESFINEIQILTRLRHRNLVSLYGCTSRHSRELLLVYEYIPNGTVSCHLHGDKAKSGGTLPWPVRMKIAIETAGALAYLHACDIIHRDVKTSNILLDNNFCVKVADFGLSRLFPNDVTHISTAPRGTPGYVDPDYRICYQLTSKSDVYSFGVVLVELISSLPAVDMNRDSDEIKLANLAIRKIQEGAFSELVDPSLPFQSDDKLRRMVISTAKLAFRCLQGDKNLRPCMNEVLEVLQRIEIGRDEPANLEGIEVHGAGVSLSNPQPLLPNSLTKPKRLHQTL